MSDGSLQHRSRHLLSLARTIRHYEEALTKANGERFNVFDILHVGHYEVRTHSPMLAELLNPKGAHGQGHVFLQHFLTSLKIPDFDAASARVFPEVSIGDLGRLDIEITDRNNRRILIENKIYAGLQEKQLERYHEHDRKAHLLFLTLNGEFPSDWEVNPVYKTKSFSIVYQSVSYRTDIVRWLECCRKEAVTAPGVREAITQYIHLIQRLTQQNTSARMNQQITKAITDDTSGETYLAYASLYNAAPAIRQALVLQLNTQLEVLGKELGLELVQVFAAMGERYEGCFFTTAALRAQNLQFGIECQSPDYRNFCFGFTYLDPKASCALKTELKRVFQVAFGPAPSSEVWPVCPGWDEHRNWEDETMSGILTKDFSRDLKALFSKLADVAAEACKSVTK